MKYKFYFLLLTLLSVSVFAKSTYQQCVSDAESADAFETESFRYLSSHFISSGFETAHVSNDFITTEGHYVNIIGKFSYGIFSKDLEEEKIEVYLADCEGSVTQIGSSLTDLFGMSHFTIKPENLPPVGEYTIIQRVVGDGSTTMSTLRVYPKGTRLVVFDIDGTLTTSDGELFKEIAYEAVNKKFTQEARKGAARTTQLRAEQNYEIVYLTGRHYLLTKQTRRWLLEQEFAPGTLQVASSIFEVAPFKSGVGDYKVQYLQVLSEMGFVIDAAYGNSSTDIYAYNKADLEKEQIYILGEKGGDEGTTDLGEDFLQHLSQIEAQTSVEQPFDR